MGMHRGWRLGVGLLGMVTGLLSGCQAESASSLSSSSGSSPSAGESTSSSASVSSLSPSSFSFDDQTDFNPPSYDYRKRLDGVSYGKTETVAYDSKLLHRKRPLAIHRPADYDPSKSYPVFYLFHGLGGDEQTWFSNANADLILDNLVAKEGYRPAILVSPNLNLNATDSYSGDTYREDFDQIANEMADSILPYVNAHYSVSQKREDTFLCGFSYGGRETFYTAYSQPDRFSAIGAFAPYLLNGYSGGSLSLYQGFPTDVSFDLILLSVGTWDPLRLVAESLDRTMTRQGIDHLFYESDGTHDYPVFALGFYNFAKRALILGPSKESSNA